MLGNRFQRLRMHDEDESDIIVYDVAAHKLAQVVYVVPLHIELVVLGEHIFDAPVTMAVENGHALRDDGMRP